MPELRAEALKAQPPAEHGDFLTPDLVELVKLDPTLKLDIHYASSNNFLGTPLYEEARAFLQRPAAEALVRANRKLHEQGYGLLIFDGYRPWYVTKIFWDATPPVDHIYVADPAQGSRHNRGCAVDLTIYDLKTGQALPMPSGYDEMSERAHSGFHRRHGRGARQSRPAAYHDGSRRVHRLSRGVVALRLQRLAKISDRERTVRAAGRKQITQPSGSSRPQEDSPTAQSSRKHPGLAANCQLTTDN